MLYESLGEFVHSRVVEVNRAMAIANANNLSERLALLAAVEAQGELEEFQPFWAACGTSCPRRTQG
jgi:predicted RNA polymerase sigma factor